MTLGLDIDDTITRHPAFFALVAAAMLDAGHRVVIITMRVDRPRAMADLARMGVRRSTLHVFPEDGVAGEYCRLKIDICRIEAVDLGEE